MSKITDKLHAVGIHNSYAIVARGHPLISIHTPHGREVIPRAVTLELIGRKFKSAVYYEHGAKWFTYQGKEGRDEAYEKAFVWVKNYAPNMKMVKSPFTSYDYIPEEDLKIAIKLADGKV